MSFNLVSYFFFRSGGALQETYTTPFDEFVYTKQDLHRYSLENPDKFWGALAQTRLQWDKKWETTLNADLSEGKIEWFKGGKINASGKLSF